MWDEAGRKLDLTLLEGASYLVRRGWSEQYVLYEIPHTVFNKLVLAARKQDLLEQQQLGLTFTAALATLFSKDAGQKAADAVKQSIDSIDRQLEGFSDSETQSTGSQSRPQPSPNRIMAMVKNFHGNFQKLTGVKTSLSTVLERVKRSAPKAEDRS